MWLYMWRQRYGWLVRHMLYGLAFLYRIMSYCGTIYHLNCDGQTWHFHFSSRNWNALVWSWLQLRLQHMVTFVFYALYKYFLCMCLCMYVCIVSYVLYSIHRFPEVLYHANTSITLIISDRMPCLKCTFLHWRHLVMMIALLAMLLLWLTIPCIWIMQCGLYHTALLLHTQHQQPVVCCQWHLRRLFDFWMDIHPAT